MTRMELPTTPGDYNIDGISIIVLPGKIIVDTGGRIQTTPQRQSNRSASTHSGNGTKKESKKKPDMLNTILDNCQEFVMPGSTKKGR